MGRATIVILGVLAGLALGGCGEYPLKESQVEATLPARTASITAGQTDRAEVRRLLGEPLAASSYWRFDLYRLSDKDVQLHWYLFPMAVSSQDVNGYILVEYDDHGMVTASQHGLVRESSALLYDLGAEANVVAGDVQFTAGEESALVAVGADRRDEFLSENTASERCRVLIGCPSSPWCFVRLKVDGGSQFELPAALGDRPSALVVQELTAGTHSIEATPALSRVAFAGATTFACAAGETRFIALELSPDDTKGVTVFRRHLFARFAVATSMPESLADLPMVIWRDGRWLVPQEPGR